MAGRPCLVLDTAFSPKAVAASLSERKVLQTIFEAPGKPDLRERKSPMAVPAYQERDPGAAQVPATVGELRCGQILRFATDRSACRATPATPPRRISPPRSDPA